MKSKQCIFCRDVFFEASPEHVIPKSIGGQYTIHNVCEKCNSRLNTVIDEPFKKHVLIGTQRVAFDSKGRNKNVPDPLSGKSIFLDGKEYSLKLNKDLTVNIKLKPNFPKKTDIKIGESFQIEINENDTESANSYLEKLASHLNVSPEEIVITNIKKNHRPATNHTIKTENNILLLEFSKILFETASDLFGGVFIDDPIAEKYRNMLISGTIDYSIQSLISPQQSILINIFSQLLGNNQILSNKHLIILSGIDGIGLVGFLKIYDLCHIQILSTSPIFYSCGIKIVANDFENKTLKILEPNQLPNCSLSVDRNQIHDEELLNAEFTDSPFDQDYLVFNAKGDIIANNLFELPEKTNFRRTGHTDFESSFTVKLYFDNEIFIKSKSTNALIPIESISYNYLFSVIKER